MSSRSYVDSSALLISMHEKLCVRFDLVQTLLKKINKKKHIKNKYISEHQKTIEKMREEYDLNIARFLLSNARAEKNESEKRQNLEEYQIFLSRSDIDRTLNRIVADLKKRLIKNKVENNQRINQLINSCESPAFEPKSQRVDINICECGNTTEMFPRASELRCRECAVIEELKGTEFEEHAVQDPNQQKKGDYDPSRFVDLWIERIQANKEIDFRDKKTGREEPLIAIQEQAIKDGMKNANEYSCKYIRQVWKNKGFTSYNNDAEAKTRCFGPILRDSSDINSR